MRIQSTSAALVLLSTVMFTAHAHAQGTDSVVFRSGQWGADFLAAGGFAGVGALRFSSPKWAWLVDLGAGFTHSATALPGSSYSTDGLNLSVKVGRRRYGTIVRRVAPWSAFGVTLAYGWHRTRQDTITVGSQSTGGGLFGTLGATWFVTSHLGLGAQWGVNVLYVHQTTSGAPPTYASNGFSVSLPNMALVGQLYF